MKKVIFSALAAIAAGLYLMLYYCLTPSKQVYCFTADSDDTLYTVAQYNTTSGIRITGGSRNADYTVNLNKVIGENYQYFDILCIGQEVYLLGEGYDGTDSAVRVDRFSTDGKYLGMVLSIKLEDGVTYFTTNFIETYDCSESNRKSYYVTLCQGSSIYVQKIMSGGRSEDLKRYSLGDGNTADWAGIISGGTIVFQDADGRYNVINSDMEIVQLDTGAYNFASQCMIENTIYGVDLTNISLSGLYFFNDGDGGIGTGFIDNVGGMRADTEIADGILFSDLRNVRNVPTDDNGGSYNFMGICKEDGQRGKIVIFSLNGGDAKVYDEPLLFAGNGLLMSVGLAATVFVAVFILLSVISRLLALRKVIVKQVLISVIIIAASFSFMMYSSRVLMERLLDNNETSALGDMLDYIAEDMDIDSFAENGIDDDTALTIDRFEERLPLSFSINGGLILSHMKANVSAAFIKVARLVDGRYYYSYYYGMQTPEALASYYTSQDTLDKIDILEDRDILVTKSISLNREWFEVSRSLFGSSGDRVGFITIGLDHDSLQNSAKSVSLWLASFWCAFICVMCAMFLLFLVKLLSPLKKIKKAVSEVSEGRIGTRVTLKTNDELQDIAASFSEMSVKLEKYFNDINLISKAYERYLPKDFFRLMGKGSVLEVSPEDSRNVVLVYLFVVIDTSRVHSETGGLAALNRIYGLVSETVSAFGGAVQSLDDRQITCIFSEDTSSAVEAALTIREKLTAESLSDADVRISLQRAESTIGVIGTGETMKPVTVSSAIEFNRYISAIMDKFDLSCVITEHVADTLGSGITVRYIGLMSELYGLSGSRYEIRLYDVPEGCTGDEKQLRLATLAAFNSGMEAFAAGNTREARCRMIEVLRVNRGDLMARHYMMLCEENVSLLKENKDELRNN